MVPIPGSMKAWIVARSGDPKDALDLKTEWPTPAPPKAGNLLIKVSYAVLNPLDLVLMRWPTFFKRNAVPIVDFAGEVVQVGPSVSSTTPNIRVGMTVCGTVPVMMMLRGFGTLAEYIVLPAHAVGEKPAGLEDEGAGSLMGVVGQTTSVLLQVCNFAAGDRVLVYGASGGVGCILTQVLRAKGVQVTAICSAKNESLVRRLGAEEVVDYTAYDSLYDHLATRFEVRQFDTVVDLIGDETLYKRCPGYLKPNGRFFSIAGSHLRGIKTKVPVILGGTPRSYTHVMNDPSGKRAREAAGWFEKGWIKEVPIDSIYKMDDALQAFERLASKHARGKVVVKVS